MRLVTGISIAFISMLIALMVACASDPPLGVEQAFTTNFTEDDVTKLIRFWSKVQLTDREHAFAQAEDRRFTLSQYTSDLCLAVRYAEYMHQPLKGESINLWTRQADNPTVTIEHIFKPDVWLVNVTTVRGIPKKHLEKILLSEYDGFNVKLVDGKLQRECLYQVNDETGDVIPVGHLIPITRPQK